MNFRCYWRVRCDNCGKESRPHRKSDKSETSALRRGWISGGLYYGGTVHLCVECARIDRPDWWPDDRD